MVTSPHSATLLAALSIKRKGLGFSIDSIVGQKRENSGEPPASPPPAQRRRSESPIADNSTSPHRRTPPSFRDRSPVNHHRPVTPKSEPHDSSPSASPVNLINTS